jgi:hypothetical protein
LLISGDFVEGNESQSAISRAQALTAMHAEVVGLKRISQELGFPLLGYLLGMAAIEIAEILQPDKRSRQVKEEEDP